MNAAGYTSAAAAPAKGKWTNGKGKAAGKGSESASADISEAAKGRAASSTATLAELLARGPVAEDQERASKTRSQGGPKAERARIAAETLSIIAAGGYKTRTGTWASIKTEVAQAVEASEFHPARGQVASCKAAGGSFAQSIEVRCCKVLGAAHELARSSKGARVGVLNFASARNPGGGFTTGAEAQEESIARSSAIYPCLSKHMDAFFEPNRRARSGAYTHDMIYSPHVPVIRDDYGVLLDTPYRVDFLTSPAPNAGVMMRDDRQGGLKKASEILRERVERMLQLFAASGAVDLVLGAWGCGVFGNDPMTVANIFKEQLSRKYHGCFRNIVFAVLDREMAQVFQSVFWTGREKSARIPGSAPDDAPFQRAERKQEGARKDHPAAKPDVGSEEDVSGPSEVEKEILKTAKLLREIVKLEEKQAEGSRLQAGQTAKVERKEGLLQKLAGLCRDLPADSPLRTSHPDIFTLV